MRLLAIDPGLHGGWALLSPDTGLFQTGRMPTCWDSLNFTMTRRRRVDLESLRNLVVRNQIEAIVTEYQTAMPGQSSVATATTFLNWGMILGLRLFAPVSVVHPRVWKRHFGIGSNKKVAIAMAMHRFPSLGTNVLSDGEAEAILIGQYWLEKGQGIAQAAAIKASLPKRRKKAKARRLRKSGRGDAPSPAVRTV